MAGLLDMYFPAEDPMNPANLLPQGLLGPGVLSRMRQADDAQRARWQAGERGPTPLTEENIWLADDVAGGLLGPMALAGIIESIPAPAWNRAARSLEVGINPTRRELSELFKQEDTLRVLMSGDRNYFWPASQALHDDIGAAFKLDPKQTRHGLVGREQLR